MSTTDGHAILVVPFADGIGDFVMMLPLIDAVRRSVVDSTIAIAASARSAALLDDSWTNVAVQTPSWLADERPRPRGGPLRRLVPLGTVAAAAGIALRIELGRFDRVLNFVRWWEDGMAFARYWTPQLPALSGAVHTIDHLAARLERELGAAIAPLDRTPRIVPRPDAADWARGWLARYAHARPAVALLPAANMAIKRWPVSRWAEVAAWLDDTGYQPVLFLPPRPDPAEAIARLARCALPTVREPLDRVAALLAGCALAVGVDTGLLHVAAAVRTRFVGLFGPTNPLVTGPYQRDAGTSLVAPFAKARTCRDCWRSFKYLDDRCQTLGPASCISRLTRESVVAACWRELTAATARTAAGTRPG